jgi:hypothetical protein
MRLVLSSLPAVTFDVLSGEVGALLLNVQLPAQKTDLLTLS